MERCIFRNRRGNVGTLLTTKRESQEKHQVFHASLIIHEEKKTEALIYNSWSCCFSFPIEPMQFSFFFRPRGSNGLPCGILIGVIIIVVDPPPLPGLPLTPYPAYETWPLPGSATPPSSCPQTPQPRTQTPLTPDLRRSGDQVFQLLLGWWPNTTL